MASLSSAPVVCFYSLKECASVMRRVIFRNVGFETCSLLSYPLTFRILDCLDLDCLEW